MVRVTAQTIATYMVNYWYILTEASRNWAYQPCIYNSMNPNFRAIKSYSSVSIIILVTNPIPTLGSFIKLNLSKYTSYCVPIKFFYIWRIKYES